MKVIEVINQSCTLLGLNIEQAILQNEELEDSEKLKNEDINKLFNLVQFSLRELCTNYLEITTIQQVASEYKQVSLNCLTNFIRLVDVYYNDNSIPYKVKNRKINLDFDGTFIIKYQTYPEINALSTDLEEFGIFNTDAVVIGLCAYYSLATGRFEEFNNFHNQYVDKAESIKSLRSLHLPARRWE